MKPFYTWNRDLHLYAGLFLAPFIVLFAVSTILLNHGSSRGAESATPPATKKNLPVDIPDGTGTVEQAKNILRQLQVTGEIDYIRHNAKAERLYIPVTKPGHATKVEVDLKARTASVEQQERGLAEALIYLHRMPGPHNVGVRGNWIYMTWWGVTADVVVYGILFLTITGVYLWWKMRAERRAGWLLLGGGTATVALFVAAICSA